MRAVVDTNVIVAGLLSPFGPPAEIVRMIAAGTVTVCFDARILTEYAEVLARARFGFGAEHVHALLEQVRAGGVLAAAVPWPGHLPDPADAAFLEVAAAGEARCLVTGNLRHFPAAARRGVTVLRPAEFLDLYRETARRGPAKR